MDMVLNVGLAWASVLLAGLLAIIYALRRHATEHPRFQSAFERVNRFLRRRHKALGLALIATGLVHGLMSSESVLSFNLGTIAWALSSLLGLNWLFKRQVKGRKGWMHLHRSLTVALCVILLMHIANVGVQAPQILLASLRSSTATASLSIAGQPAAGARAPVQTLPAAVSESTDASDGDLADVRRTFAGVALEDGTYTGAATGYGAGLTVQVAVRGGAVSSVQVVSHNEVNSRYYARPIQLIPPAIVSGQRLDVDLVTGATFTSVGIVNAVRDALTKAVVSGTLPSALNLPARGRKR